MILKPIIPIWLMLIISIALIAYIIYKNKKINKKSILRLSLILILFIINLRPMLKTGDVNISTANLNILFVVDTTLSMNAEDMKNSETRMDHVKEDCEYIVKAFPSANYSLISFSNDSKIQIPFTTDKTMLLNSVSVLHAIDELYANGSSLNTPQKDMLKVLKNAKEKNDNLNILFFISDGEITGDDKLKSYENIKEYVDDGAILGYGTEKGGYMKYIDYDDKEVYVTYYDSNYNEKKGVSKLDKDNLEKIAKDIKIDYINMDKQSNIDGLIKEINKKATSKISDDKQTALDDIYYIFVIPLLIILFLIYKEYKEEYSL